MSMSSPRKSMKIAGFLGAAALMPALMTGSVYGAVEGKIRPNILFFLVDDLGQRDVGCYGSDFYKTPNIDRLAQQGMLFTDGYAACPVCSPTRASILTGKYPARLHLTDFIPGHVQPKAKLKVPDWTQFLPLEEITLAEALKPAGYKTAMIGKWHLGGAKYSAELQGFDFNIGGSHQGQPTNYFSPYKLHNIRDDKEGEYLTDRLTDEALTFIESNKQQPFFLYLAHYAVHTPHQAKSDLINEFRTDVGSKTGENKAVYAAMIKSVDESLGRLTQKLDNLGLSQNTIIVFMSDNGGLMDNSPLRSIKGTLYEGGIREPWIVKWPGVVKAGAKCRVPVTSVDFFPTLLELADVKMDRMPALDGMSIVPLLKEVPDFKREAIYWHYPHYHAGKPGGAIRCGDFKLIEYYEDGKLELYDLSKDLSETEDLAAKMPAIAAELRQKLELWRRGIGAQMPVANPDYDPSAPVGRLF